MSRPALNCPEAYHIEHLYQSGYGCTRIARAIGRSVSYVERSVRGCPVQLCCLPCMLAGYPEDCDRLANWQEDGTGVGANMPALSREFLLSRGSCCWNGCRNCPYTEESMTHPSKRKGNAYERELVNQAKDSGLEAKRAWASNGRSLGLHEEVDLVVCDKRIQAKRRKSIASYLLPNQNVDAVAFRPDAGETVVLLTWWEYLDLVKGCQLNKDGNDDALQSAHVHK